MESDFSFLALFLRASFVVQLVMLILLIASIWSWTVIIGRIMTYRRTRSEAAIFDAAFWSGEPLDELYGAIGDNPVGASEKIFAAGMLEWRRSHRTDGALIAFDTAPFSRKSDICSAT